MLRCKKRTNTYIMGNEITQPYENYIFEMPLTSKRKAIKRFLWACLNGLFMLVGALIIGAITLLIASYTFFALRDCFFIITDIMYIIIILLSSFILYSCIKGILPTHIKNYYFPTTKESYFNRDTASNDSSNNIQLDESEEVQNPLFSCKNMDNYDKYLTQFYSKVGSSTSLFYKIFLKISPKLKVLFKKNLPPRIISESRILIITFRRILLYLFALAHLHKKRNHNDSDFNGLKSLLPMYPP